MSKDEEWQLEFVSGLEDLLEERKLFLHAQERKHGRFVANIAYATLEVMNGVDVLGKISAIPFVGEKIQKQVEENFDVLMCNLCRGAGVEYDHLVVAMKEQMQFTEALKRRVAPNSKQEQAAARSAEELLARMRK